MPVYSDEHSLLGTQRSHQTVDYPGFEQQYEFDVQHNLLAHHAAPIPHMGQ